ncbi:MAG: HAD domain-containing protein [Bacilli bacterium]|jgi:hypothetical protein
MKILFLDCDGVINNEKSFKDEPIDPIDQVLANRIKVIQLLTGCGIVLSSVWRNSPELVAKVEEKIGKVFGVTPNATDPNRSERGDEIAMWLEAHPGVKKYAILDDDLDILLEQIPNFFNTSFKLGITENTMFKVISHLNY